MPRSGDVIQIIPTHIVGPNKMYAQILDTDFTEFQECGLQTLQLKKVEQTEGRTIFGHEEMTNIKNKLYISELNGFYLAKYCYDGLIYRVRLLSHVRDDKLEVFTFVIENQLNV